MKVDKSKWEVKKLGKVCNILNGYAFKSNLFKEDGERIIRISNINNGFIDIADAVYFNIEDYNVDLSKFVIYKNDILIALSGATTGKIGKYILDNISYLNQRVGLIRSKNNISNSFLYYYMRNKTKESLSLAYGVAQPNLSTKTIQNYVIPVPPLPEQQAIASELDAIQSLITKYKEQLNDYDNLAKSIFNEMFGDVVSNDKGWESQLFGNLFILKSGDGLSSKQQLGGEYPVYGGNGINGQHCKYNKDGEYIIIGRVGAYCGNVRLVKGRFWLTDNGFELVVKKNNQIKLFLKYLLTSLHLGRYAHKAAQPVISNLVLKNISVPLPPLSLQQAFAARIIAIESQKDKVKQQITDLQTLFDSRMQYYFD